MPKRPDYGDASPEELARAVMLYRRTPKKEKDFESERIPKEKSDCLPHGPKKNSPRIL